MGEQMIERRNRLKNAGGYSDAMPRLSRGK